jgi:hypothetical protein
VGEEVRQMPVDPRTPEVLEVWFRETDDPGIRNVNALARRSARRDQVLAGRDLGHGVRAGRPARIRLPQHVTDALRQVSGVISADEQDRETWSVTGNPSGDALVEAAARVVDDLTERVRDFMYGPEDGGFWSA